MERGIETPPVMFVRQTINSLKTKLKNVEEQIYKNQGILKQMYLDKVKGVLSNNDYISYAEDFE